MHFHPAVVRVLVRAHDGPADRRELLASVGLPPDGGSGRDPALVPAEDVYALLERLVADGDGGLAFRYAGTVSPDTFGAAGLAFKTARTLRGALERTVRYLALVTDTAAYELRVHDGGGALVLHRTPHRRGTAVANEAGLAAVLALLRQVGDEAVRPDSVAFEHQPTTDPAAYVGFFGCSVGFGADETVMRLGRDVLDTRTRLGDEGLSRFVLTHLEADLRETREAAAVETAVRRVVADSLSEGAPRLADVAARLGTSERSLQRRLGERGLAYSGLVEAVRRDLAQSLLATSDHAIVDVAFLSGFSEQSAFHRAFRRWTGRTPAAYRLAATSG